MKKTILVMTALASALALSACGNTQQDRALGGAALGGLAGAAIGGAATGKLGGALAGGALGAAGGAILGAATAPQPRCARFGYDYYGNRVCTRYYQ